MRILVAGGFRDGASPLSYWYDVANDAWTQAPWLKRRRDCAAAAVVLGQIYVTGGRDSGYEDENACERFDPTTGAWTAAANLRHHRHNHGAASVAESGAAESFDTRSGIWHALAPMPSGCSNPAVVRVRT